MGDSGPCVYTGKNDPLERERGVIQEGQAMAKGTKTCRLGATGSITEPQSLKRLLSSPHVYPSEHQGETTGKATELVSGQDWDPDLISDLLFVEHLLCARDLFHRARNWGSER